MTKRMVMMLAAAGLLFGGIFGYKAFVARMIQKSMRAQGPPPVTVSTTRAEMQPWQPQLTAVGTVRALRGVDVTTEVAGIVENITFQSGQDVKQGQVLVQLDTREDKAKLLSLQASAELAQTTYRRDKRQSAANAISEATLDAARADLKVKRAQVAQQQALIDKKTIRAPFDGRVGINTVNPGQYLNPGENIVTLQSFDTVYVDFYLPQQNLADIATKQNVIVTTNTYPGRTFQGWISAINPKVDPQSRNIQIEATIANPTHALVPGMFASVDVHAGQARRHLTLPQAAVTYNPYGDTVYVVRNQGTGPQGKPSLIAKQVFVTVGEHRDDKVAILKGLEEGETVVTGGQLKLKSGSPITINNAIQPDAADAPAPADE
jgi:membrane fusion protein (multidrug efflux system)